MIALGGNALLERHDRPDAALQRHHIRAAAVALAPLAEHHQLILCHGNGPQIGLLAAESEGDTALSAPYPLDALGAQTQGMIGYWLAQELANAGVQQPIASVLTRTLVDVADPAFSTPTKFIGAIYTEPQAQELRTHRRWTMAADGTGWRRVVPSPEPVRIMEEVSIRTLLDAGSLVICGGGGGVPVASDRRGRLFGVEAVVDKDYTAAKMAVHLAADRLLLLTDVPAVMRDFGTPDAVALRRLTLVEIADLRLPNGSMGPKVAACARFTAATGHISAIGALTEATAVLAGTSGTSIVADHRTSLGARAHAAAGSER